MKISSLVLMEMRPLLLKLVVALAAISAALIYSHLKKRRKPPPTLQSPSSGEHKTVLSRKIGLRSEYRAIQNTINAGSTESEDNEETSYQKAVTDSTPRFSRRSKSCGGFVSPEFDKLLCKQYSTGFSPTKDFEKPITFTRANKRRLEEQVTYHSRIVAELESTKAKLELLKWSIKSDAEQSNEDISAQMLKESNQIMGTSALDVSEVESLRETNHCLRKENEELAKENDQLQAKCCDDAKEQVYLKWVNACLRYELRNLQAPSGKTLARDLSKNLSPRSEEKARQLVLEYSDSDVNGGGSLSSMDFNSDSSETSHLAEIGKVAEISSALETKKSRRARLFRKIKKLVLHKGSDHSNHISAVSGRNNASRRREWRSMDSFEAETKKYSCSSLSSPYKASHLSFQQHD